MEQRITQKAQELFFRYGTKSVTMDDIASNLGVSKKTIYQYYTDKDSLVDAVLQKEISQNSAECIRQNASSENAVHEMFMAMEMMQTTLAAMNPAVIFDMQKYHPGPFNKFIEFKNKFLYEMIRNNICRGQKEEFYREDLNVDILAKFRIESIFIGMNPEIFNLSKYSLLQVEMEIMENFLYGICTPKGQKQLLKYKKQSQTTNI